jgi:hypothetical protein
MQRRTMVGILAVLALTGVLALMASSSMADTFGNAATPRTYNGDGPMSNYAFSDVNPESPIVAGQWKLGQDWHLYVQASLVDIPIDLLVWRMVNASQYQLIVRDPVVIPAGITGTRDIAVGSASKSAVLQPNDCLGFYVPYTQLPAVLFFDQASGTGDPYYGPLSGGATWAVNDIASLTHTTVTRQYSLNVDVLSAPEPTSILALATGLVGLVVMKRRVK